MRINDPTTYSTYQNYEPPTISAAFEQNIRYEVIRAELEYIGLYDVRNERLLMAFSPDLATAYALSENLPIDLTIIPADIPFKWQY